MKVCSMRTQCEINDVLSGTVRSDTTSTNGDTIGIEQWIHGKRDFESVIECTKYGKIKGSYIRGSTDIIGGTLTNSTYHVNNMSTWPQPTHIPIVTVSKLDWLTIYEVSYEYRTRTKQVSIIKMDKIREKYTWMRFDGYQFDNWVLSQYTPDVRVWRHKIVKDK